VLSGGLVLRLDDEQVLLVSGRALDVHRERLREWGRKYESGAVLVEYAVALILRTFVGYFFIHRLYSFLSG